MRYAAIWENAPNGLAVPPVVPQAPARDGTPAESFLATLKKELVYRRTFRTRAEARVAIRHWIEAWYNRRRLHSVLGYLSPIEREDHYRHATNTLAA